jgi:pimeloyl-ACP methyl ester carboxylesterase
MTGHMHVRLRLPAWLAFVLLVVVSACSANPSATAGPRTFSLGGQPLSSCTLTGTRGIVMAAQCGTLKVAENPGDPEGRKVDLYVAVLPAAEPGTPSEPVFFIAGGPGGSTIADWAEAPNIFVGLTAHHDIVLVDQRGTGRSHMLVLPPPSPDEAPADYAKRALGSIDGDPRYYTTAAAMDDLDAVRQALGYDKINLYGNSYGATAVQYYIRQHGDHVRAAVLDGGTLVDVPIFELMAHNSQRALDDVLGRCLADRGCASAYPNVRTELKDVMARLGRKPVATDVMDSSGQAIVVTSDVFTGAIHQLLVGSDSGAIPWLIHQAWSGNLTAVAIALSRYIGTSGQMLVMTIEILCSEAWAKNDPDRVKALGQGSYLLPSQVAVADSFARACRYVAPGYVLPDDAQPVRSTVPILLLNGSDDPQDPPSNVAEARRQMPNSLLVVPPGQGHTVGNIGCLPGVVVDFFDKGKTNPAAADACVADLQPPEFRLN